MLAGIVMKGGGYGLLWDIIVGLSESIVESGLFQALGCRTRVGAGQVSPRSSGRPS